MNVSKLFQLLGEPASWRYLMSTRTAPAVEHLPMLRYFRPDIVIDAGANRGQFALAAKMSGVRDIISFEPIPSEAAIFKRNMRGCKTVTLHNYAVSDIAGTATFYVTNRPDSSSLLKPGDGQRRAFGISGREAITVEVRRLDDVIDVKVLENVKGLLKIDVQGAEKQVLLGATKLLSALQYVYAECSYTELYEGQDLANELIDLMMAHGFAVRGVYNTTETDAFGPTQSDFLFSRVSN